MLAGFLLMWFTYAGIATTTSGQLAAECTNYVNLTDINKRSEKYVSQPGIESMICDRLTIHRGTWYRFGTAEMVNNYVSTDHCGTHIPLWMNGAFPKKDQSASVQICGPDSFDIDQCSYTDNIMVRNCNNRYYVYLLNPTMGCDVAYCAGIAKTCPFGKAGPNCDDELFPVITKSPTATPFVSSNNSFWFKCHIDFNNTRADVGFEVSWLFDNQTNNRTQTTRINGTDRDVYQLMDFLPGVIQKTVTCIVRSFLIHTPNEISPNVSSSEYFCGFKYDPINVTIDADEGETVKTVTIVDTCPIVCRNKTKCEVELLVVNNRSDTGYSQTTCSVVFNSTHWNNSTMEARRNFPIATSSKGIDKNSDLNHVASLKFAEIISGYIPLVYKNTKLPELLIHVKTTHNALCMLANDPWGYSFDYDKGKPWVKTPGTPEPPHTPQFEMMLIGEFVMAKCNTPNKKNTARDFQVEVRTKFCPQTVSGSGVCVCGVAAREFNDAVVIDVCNTDFGVPLLQTVKRFGNQTKLNRNGQRLTVEFISGSQINADVHENTLTVGVFVTGTYFECTEGLCGNFNGKTDDDFKRKNGKTDPPTDTKPKEFIESWRIPINDSIFDQIKSYHGNSQDLEIMLCQCDNTTNITKCAPQETNGVFSPNMKNNNNKNNNNKPNAPGRRKRAALYLEDDEYPAPYIFDYGIGYTPKYRDFPTLSGKTRAFAEQACEAGFKQHSTVQQCVSIIGFDYRPFSSMCVEDFKYTDNLDYSLRGALRVAEISCTEIALNNASLYDQDNKPPAFITTDLCIDDCSGHGTCIRGTCYCDAGYTDDNCGIDTRIPPNVLFYISAVAPKSPLCDITVRVCETAFVAGSNFYENPNLSCKVEELLFDGSAFKPSGRFEITSVEYRGYSHVGCRLPTGGNVLVGYNISISNNGITFSNEVQFIRMDTSCMDCGHTGLSCTIKDKTCFIDGKCKHNGEKNPTNPLLVCDSDKNELGWTSNITTPDDYCKTMFSRSSYLCRDASPYRSIYDSVCSSLYCFDALNTMSCVLINPPHDNTLCGNGKWCEARSCQQNPLALKTKDVCPLGDSTKPNVALNMNCKHLIAKRPSMCNDDTIGKTWCCETCGHLNKTDPAMFFGPAVSTSHDCKSIYGPSSYFCQSLYINQDYSGVCKTMHCFNPVTWNCDPFPARDGVPCGNGKWCIGGQCTISAAAPLVPTTSCLYGNQYEPFCRMNVVYPNVAKFCTQNEQGCCDTCLPLKNTSMPVGCQYGDTLPDVCLQHVLNKTIHAYCYSSESNCCHTCNGLKSSPNPNCTYGDFDPVTCNALMSSDLGAAHCYNISHQQLCCDSCYRMKNASTPGCPYGDTKPAICSWLFNDSRGVGNCYDWETQTECCRSCGNAWNDSLGKGCEYGDRRPGFCTSNIYSASTAHLCFSYEDECCLTCPQYKLSDHNECKYGDKNPVNCQQQIPDAAAALALCPTLALQCCQTCGKLGHPVTGAKLVTDIFVG